MKMFAMFDEIPSISFQVIKVAKRYGWIEASTDNIKNSKQWTTTQSLYMKQTNGLSISFINTAHTKLRMGESCEALYLMQG